MIQIHKCIHQAEKDAWWMEHALGWVELLISRGDAVLAGRWAAAMARVGVEMLARTA